MNYNKHLKLSDENSYLPVTVRLRKVYEAKQEEVVVLEKRLTQAQQEVRELERLQAAQVRV